MSSSHKLAIADNRTVWFEAICDTFDALRKESAQTQALTAQDFLPENPVNNRAILTQHRLSALKTRVASYQKSQQEQSQKRPTQEHFIKGLLA